MAFVVYSNWLWLTVAADYLLEGLPNDLSDVSDRTFRSRLHETPYSYRRPTESIRCNARRQKANNALAEVRGIT